MVQKEKFISEEYPKGDFIQIVMLGLFITTWALDSFLLKYTQYGSIAPWYLRVASGLLIVLFGTYLVDASHKLVIDVDEPVLVDWGIYSQVRHPMYLGIMLVYLGLSLSTFSLASLLLLAGIFVVYDRFADYEESKIIEKLGQRYLDYKKHVRRWLPL